MAYTIGIYTLGCRVNQYESSALAKLFSDNGFCITPFNKPCDAYVINTCTVTAESDRKSLKAVRRAVSSGALVAVCGCSSQLDGDRYLKAGASFVCGTRNKLELFNYIKNNVGKTAEKAVSTPEPSSLPYEKMHGISTERTRAYVKIQDGCDGACTYCAIKNARGKSVSRDREDILSEVRELSANGFCEVVLTGIETSSYTDLPSLVKEAAEIPDIKRIRLGSLDPSFLRKDTADELLSCEKLCCHFHLSVQSGNDRILALMKRKYNSSILRRNIENILSLNSDFRFSCDIIAGFPTEGDEELEDTASLLRDYPFVHAHIFPYSERAGTPASVMQGSLDIPTRKAHAEYLDKISKEKALRLISRDAEEKKVLSVLFETYKNGTLCGHALDFTEVYMLGKESLKGKIVSVNADRIEDGKLFAR